jgi:ubiquinone/menaquinone biosynthesis C-methylase UbiE
VEKLRAILEERLALMAPARRLRLKAADRALSRWAGERPIRLLDAGCGDGLMSLALAKRHPKWTIVGVDIRDDLLGGARKRAQARGLDNVSFEIGDLLEPLPLSRFDACSALECLSEIPDDEAALRTMWGALRPGGVVVAQVPDRDWKPVMPGSATTWREQVRQGYDGEGLTRVLRQAGFDSVTLESTYRSLAESAQEIRDRIKGSGLAVRLIAFPPLAGAVVLEHHGITWGRPNAIFAMARRPDQ